MNRHLNRKKTLTVSAVRICVAAGFGALLCVAAFVAGRMFGRMETLRAQIFGDLAVLSAVHDDITEGDYEGAQQYVESVVAYRYGMIEEGISWNDLRVSARLDQGAIEELTQRGAEIVSSQKAQRANSE